MVFASTILGQDYDSGRRRTRGTFATDAHSGNIDTGLLTCENIMLQYAGSAVPTPTSRTTALPAAGNSIGIHCSVDTSGDWIAWGPA